MSLFLIIIHFLVCIALIMIVLLQTGKGADMGAAFGGGGSQTLFGSSGASTFLGKATTVAAVIFMLTSLSLAYRSGQPTESSIIEDTPVQETAAPQPGETAEPATEDSETADPEKSGETSEVTQENQQPEVAQTPEAASPPPATDQGTSEKKTPEDKTSN